MKTVSKIIILTFVVSSLMPASNAFAIFLKTDYVKMVGEVSMTVTDIFKVVNKAIEEGGTIKTIKGMGEGYKKYKGDFDKLRARYDKEKQGVIDDKNKVTDKYEANQQLYAEEKAKLEAQATEIEQKKKELESQKKAIEAKNISNIASADTKARIAQQNLDNNSNVYKKMIENDPANAEEYQKVIKQNDDSKTPIQETLTAEIAKANNDKRIALAPIENQIASLTKSLAGIDSLSSGKDFAKNLFGKKTDAKSANEATANKFFLTKDEVLNPENMDKMIINRSKDALETIVDSNSKSMAIKLSINPSKDFAETIKKNTAMQDGTTDALSQSTMARIEEMSVILKIIRLQALDLKSETAAEMARMPRYQRVDYNSDQGVLDLCNYKKNADQSVGAKK